MQALDQRPDGAILGGGVGEGSHQLGLGLLQDDAQERGLGERPAGARLDPQRVLWGPAVHLAEVGDRQVTVEPRGVDPSPQEQRLGRGPSQGLERRQRFVAAPREVQVPRAEDAGVQRPRRVLEVSLLARVLERRFARKRRGPGARVGVEPLGAQRHDQRAAPGRERDG